MLTRKCWLAIQSGEEKGLARFPLTRTSMGADLGLPMGCCELYLQITSMWVPSETWVMVRRDGAGQPPVLPALPYAHAEPSARVCLGFQGYCAWRLACLRTVRSLESKNGCIPRGHTLLSAIQPTSIGFPT